MAALVFACSTFQVISQTPSITGATTIAQSDILLCSTDTLASTVVCVWPAPFMLPTLSRGLVLVAAGDLGVGLIGGTGSGWTDVSVVGQACWAVTPTFRVGTVGLVGWKGADGFIGSVESSLNVQARTDLSESWRVGVGVNALLHQSRGKGLLPRFLTLAVSYSGASAMALDVQTGSDKTSAILTWALQVNDGIRGRVAVCTYPLSLGVALRFATSTILPITVGVDLLMQLGIRTMMSVEL